MAAASVAASRAFSSASGNGPGRIVSVSLRRASGPPDAPAQAVSEDTPGTTATAQREVHERPIEEGFALAEHGDTPTRRNLGQNRIGGRIVDIRLGEGAIAQGHADGDLALAAGQMGIDDGARKAFALLRRRISDDVGGADQAQRLQRQQFRVAWPNADAPDPHGGLHPHGLTATH